MNPTNNPTDELDRMCDHEGCGLTHWSCNRLQDIVYSDDYSERRKLAVEIREDMYTLKATLDKKEGVPE